MHRVNRALDFILQHLDEPLRLDAVARAAGFSPFHFHRIFRLLIGESLNEFVKRVRLEKAVVMLTRQSWPARRRPTVTEVAFACGFASSSDFTRCFKLRYGVAPSRFDVTAHRAQGREQLQTLVAGDGNPRRLDKLPPGANPDGFAPRLRRLPARRVAYLRVRNSFTEGAVVRAAARLVAWAEERRLAEGQWLG